jgi:signal transduction histidine kinase
MDSPPGLGTICHALPPLAFPRFAFPEVISLPAKTKAIKADRFIEIGRLIERDASLIIDAWSRRALAEQPKAQRVHHEVLRDGLPAFLYALGRSLAESVEGHAAAHQWTAKEHGEQRWEAGWSLREVVQDYQILRLVLLDHLDGALRRSLKLREVMAVGVFLDEAITASISRYIANRDLEIERQKDDLRLADDRKNEFLAILSHELRNYLGPIRLSLELFNGDADPEMIPQARDIIDRQTRNMTRIVDDLLDVARIAQGKIKLVKERLDFAALVKESLRIHGALLESKQHQVHALVADEPVWIDGDRVRLHQVLTNLLNNAAKYTPSGGTIRVELGASQSGASPRQAVFRIQDNGIGIAPEKLAGVFDMFAQVDGNSKLSDGGLGIGLTLARKLVELHGGSVSAASDGVGKGSVFVVSIPLAV